MSAIRLLILGILKREQPMHGYEVRRELEIWDAEQWANIAYGSIYFALNKMAEEELVEVVGTDQINKRPARTVYAITDKGRAAFGSLLRDYWWKPKPITDPFQVALTFMDALPREELLLALKFRADSLRATIAAAQRMNPEYPKGPYAPRHISANIRLILMESEARLKWLEEVIGKVERNELP